MRVAYLWSSGEISSNRYLSSYHALDPSIILEQHSNTGDLFVTEASLTLTRPEKVSVFDPANPTPQSLERLHAEADVVFIRGANTLGDEKWAAILAAFLEKVKLNVVVMGIGIQAPSRDRLPKNPGVKQLAKLLGERSKVVGVRGRITADFLEKLGVHNVQIVGCPSILRHNSPTLQLKKPAWRRVKSFGFSLTRYHGVLYQRDPTTFLQVQSRLIKELHALGRLGIITQVEREEKAFAYRDEQAMHGATEKLRQSGWFDAGMEAIYRNRSVFFGTRPSDYDMHVRNFDVVFGTRLHTNAMAISCGVPAITLTFDLRVEEIYDFWRLPTVPIEKAVELSAQEIYEQADFGAFNKRIDFVYHNFRTYLEANGVDHRMQRG
jgi:polysaccharide pyruvyl transferase WcaK-like protein